MSPAIRRQSRSIVALTSVRRTALILATFAFATIARPVPSTAQLTRSIPASLTDREFWDFFTTMSEEGGSFPSENFVSNEQTYQHVIPTLKRTVTPGGVYLGVGPEQNFTYIANLKPRMAVIFDIRRQNAMAHLMYKALFEMSPTRADFVSHLFSRPMPASLGASASPTALCRGGLRGEDERLGIRGESQARSSICSPSSTDSRSPRRTSSPSSTCMPHSSRRDRRSTTAIASAECAGSARRTRPTPRFRR